jgi:thymidylate synthase ThyX
MAKIKFKTGSVRILHPNLSQLVDEQQLYAHIKECACTCYQSREWTTKTPEQMVKGIINRKHYAMVEHTMFTFKIKGIQSRDLMSFMGSLRIIEPGFILSCETLSDRHDVIVSFNARHLINACEITIAGGYPVYGSTFGDTELVIDEDTFNNLDLQAQLFISYVGSNLKSAYPALFSRMKVPMFEHSKYEAYDINEDRIERNPVLKTKHERLLHTAICFEWNDTSIGQSREFNRHRSGNNEFISLAEESTRYCNYSKTTDSNDGEITFILPYSDRIQADEEGDYYWTGNDGHHTYLKPLVEDGEYTYKTLIEAGMKPEEARQWLFLGQKSQEVATATGLKLRRFFKLRKPSPPAHPEISNSATQLFKWCVENNIELVENLI